MFYVPDLDPAITFYHDRLGLRVNWRTPGAAGLKMPGTEAEIVLQTGRCAVVRDPWGNELVLLDMSKGRLVTDEDGRVIGNEPPA